MRAAGCRPWSLPSSPAGALFLPALACTSPCFSSDFFRRITGAPPGRHQQRHRSPTLYDMPIFIFPGSSRFKISISDTRRFRFVKIPLMEISKSVKRGGRQVTPFDDFGGGKVIGDFFSNGEGVVHTLQRPTTKKSERRRATVSERKGVRQGRLGGFPPCRRRTAARS